MSERVSPLAALSAGSGFLSRSLASPPFSSVERGDTRLPRPEVRTGFRAVLAGAQPEKLGGGGGAALASWKQLQAWAEQKGLCSPVSPAGALGAAPAKSPF